MSASLEALADISDILQDAGVDPRQAGIPATTTSPQRSEPQADPEELRRRAAPALNHRRPLEMFGESCRAMGLGGNLALATTIYLAATTRILGRRKKLQAHTYVLGPASSGKSFETDAALEHLPREGVVRFEGCSPRALIYSDKDISHRVLHYAEMDSLPIGNGEDGDAANAALSYLRTLVVNGTANYDVTVKKNGSFTTRRYTKEGPATLLVTGTKRLGDEQLASRLHEVEVTVDRDRLRSVMHAQGRLLEGGKSGPASAAIIALQEYLQTLAPIDVTIPFADALGRAILEKAKVTDPRLTREFPRVAGFTAAHSLLCIQRRERQEDGSVVATLEDYEAARSVIRELSTIREFSRFAIEVWETVNTIYGTTAKAVAVGQVAKAMLKDKSYVKRAMHTLLEGGALTDARDRPSRTAPLLVTPHGEGPCRMLLPTVEELLLPQSGKPRQLQVLTDQEGTLGTQGRSLSSQPNPLTGEELGWLGTTAAEGKPARLSAKAKVGDVRSNGRRVLELDADGYALVLTKPAARTQS